MTLRLLLSTILVTAPTFSFAQSPPTMQLNTGGTATYQSGSGSRNLTFTYPVQAGHSTNNLTVLSPGIVLNGETIKDINGNDANLASVIGNLTGTVSVNQSTVSVSTVTASPSSGTLTVGQTATITVTFTAAVTVTGTPQLALNTGAIVNYTSGSTTTALNFVYTVASGQNAGQLATMAAGAIVLNGGTITNTGVAASLTGANNKNIGTLAVNTGSSGATCSGTNFYVASNGSNSNNGTSQSTPWATIAKVNAPGLNYTQGNCINLRGGDTFTGCITLRTGMNVSGSNQTNPIVLQSYGTGRATISSNCPGVNTTVGSFVEGGRTATVTLDSVNGVTIQDLILVSTTGTTNGNTTQFGVNVYNQNGASNGLIIKNLDISGFNSAAPVDSSAGINFQCCTAVGNFQILNNTIHGNSGMASLDDNGIAVASLAHDGVVSGNTIYNLGGRGSSFQRTGGMITAFQGAQNVVISHNKIYDSGGNVVSCGGVSGIQVYEGNNITIEYNEIFGLRPISYTAGCDWDGIDLDGGATNSTVRFNYTHDNWGSGYLAWMGDANVGTWGPNYYYGNISENDAFSGAQEHDFGSMTIADTGATNPVIHVYNNTFIQANSSGFNGSVMQFQNAGIGAGSRIQNNIFYWTSPNMFAYCDTGGQPWSNMNWQNNAFYPASGGSSINMSGACSGTYTLAQFATLTGQTNGKLVNPLFAGSIPAGNCSWTPSAQTGPQPCPTNYQLQHTSTLLGTGVTIAGQAKGYYGDAVPNGVGSGTNIGSDSAPR